MTPAAAIGVISQVLTMCGIVSIRMFLPVFLYFLTMRLALAYPEYATEFLLNMAERTPSWQISSPFLTLLGLLSLLELAANRNPDLKQFMIEDFDRYAKPIVSILLTCGIVSAAQTAEVHELIDRAAVQSASFGTFTLAMVIASGAITGFCCRIRSSLLLKIHAVDPENDLGLQTLTNSLGELSLLTLFFILIFLPLLALFLTLLGLAAGLIFNRLWGWCEKQHSHECAACAAEGRETSVFDCALLCPVCHAEQPDVRRVGWFGLSGSRRLDGMTPEQHAARLLAAHRCRWCASPLNHSHACDRCGKEQWTESMETFYVRRADRRGAVLLLLALAGFIVPVGGLLLTLMLFRPLAIRPLSVHLRSGTRFLASLLMMFLKLPVLLALLVLSLFPLPGVGGVILFPFILHYFYVRRRFLRRKRIPGAASGGRPVQGTVTG